MDQWNIGQSTELYRIDGWGAGFFKINEKGHVAVTPDRVGVSAA